MANNIYTPQLIDIIIPGFTLNDENDYESTDTHKKSKSTNEAANRLEKLKVKDGQEADG